MSEPPSELSIRRATPEDAEGMVALLNPIIAARIYTAIDEPSTVASQREFVAGYPERGVFLVAEDAASGRLVGMQDLMPFSPYGHAFDHVGVMGTFVALDRHRQGIATRLFVAMFEAARAVGYEKIFTYVRADNEAGLRAYRGQGFRVVGTAERHCKIDGRYIDEVLIERFL